MVVVVVEGDLASRERKLPSCIEKRVREREKSLLCLLDKNNINK